MERRGLGKGLSALFTEAALGENLVREIPLDQIRRNPYQPRKAFDQEALEELADSIRQVGVLQPVIVRQVGLEAYELIAGERRLKAAEMAGLSSIPAIVRDSSEQQMLQVALIENLQRQDINPVEAANAYKRLMEEFNLTQEEVAQQVGKSRSLVANTLRLLKLPPYILASLERGRITEGHARAILMLPDEGQQRALWERIINDQLTVREAEHRAQESKVRAPRRPTKASGSRSLTSTNPEIKALEQNLSAYLGTKVQIIYAEGGRGRILVEFYSDEDLGRILEIIAPCMV